MRRHKEKKKEKQENDLTNLRMNKKYRKQNLKLQRNNNRKKMEINGPIKSMHTFKHV